jgi:putative holliday junction resolvase
MRKMGLDFGTKKVGVALTDERGMMAFPHGVLPNDDRLLERILALVDEKGVDAIVIGHSKNKDGGDNPVQVKINEFIQNITLDRPIPVHLESEIYSTQEAIRIQGRNAQTDAAAATIILNSYLMRQV